MPSQLFDPFRDRPPAVGHLVTLFDLGQDVVGQGVGPLGQGAGAGVSQEFQFFQGHGAFGKTVNPLGQGQVGPGSPEDFLFQPIHQGDQVVGRVVQVAVFDPAGDADHRPVGSASGGQGDGRGPFAKGRHPFVDVIHLPLREDDQGIRCLLEDFGRLPEGLQVAPLPVDAETTVALQDPLSQPRPLMEDLPGGQEVAGAAQLVGRVVHDVGIGVSGVIGGHQDPLPRRSGRPQVVQLADLDLDQLLLAVLHPLAQGPPQPDPEGVQVGRPPAGGCLLGVAIHGCILIEAAGVAQA